MSPGSPTNETPAAEIYRRTLNSYLPTEGADSLNLYQAINIIDFQLRFVTLLSAAIARSIGISALKVPRSLGFGTLQSVLRQLQREVTEASTASPRIQGLIENVSTVLDRSISTASYGQQSLKRLRDLASHGGAIPSDVNLSSTVHEISRYIESFLASSMISHDNSGRLVTISDPDDLHNVTISPLFRVDNQNRLSLFWRYTRGKAVYSLHDRQVSESVQKDEQILATLIRILSPQTINDPLRIFHTDVGDDLAAFSEAGTTPVYYDDGSVFTYFWKQASSDDAIDRHDTFRMGIDQAREWFSPEAGWVGYSQFLRTISNWKRVAYRLYHKYQEDEQQIIDAEVDTVGWSFSNVAHPGATSVKLTDLSGRTIKNFDFLDLINTIDNDLNSVGGQSEIVFVTGEAGIGKTQALFHAAKNRASKIADSSDEVGFDLPLYLYVRASGNVLADLADSIGAAVNATRGLTEDAVATLSRNGLVALLIDGFDELLGGTAYSDAIGSLRTWLDKLNGRGVTVVSARSSYYLNQYRKSIQKAELSGELSLFHRVAQLQPWSETKAINYLREQGIESTGIHALDIGERRLLRLPFFLRVYAQMLIQAGEVKPENQSVLSFLIDNYLLRESLKLKPDSLTTSLVSTEELERIFELCAEMMSTRAEHVLDNTDLELAAEIAISSDLDTRPGLRSRLSALCGLSVGTSTDVRFSFSHEVFYEHFLGGAIYRYCHQRGNDANTFDSYFLTLLRRSFWGNVTIGRFVSSAGGAITLQIVSKIDPRRHAENDMEMQIASANAGALLAASIRSSGQALVGATFDGLEVKDELDLESLECRNIEFRDCSFTSLALPSTSGWSVAVPGTQIAELRLPSAPSLVGLSKCSVALIGHIVTSNNYIEDRQSVGEYLSTAGADLADWTSSPDQRLSSMVTAKQRFLRRLADSSIGTLVLLDRDKMPTEDHRLDWIGDIGVEEWRKFLSDLTYCELARLETLATGGPKKVRLRMLVNPESVLDRSAPRGDLNQFWET